LGIYIKYKNYIALNNRNHIAIQISKQKPQTNKNNGKEHKRGLKTQESKELHWTNGEDCDVR
jgi:hypothetical protein